MRGLTKRTAKPRDDYDQPYFDVHPGMRLQDVIRQCRRGRNPLSERYHLMVPVSQLWRYREFTREETTRGRRRIEELSEVMSRGWDTDDPLIFCVGRNGSAKVCEGNHRLAVARNAGVEKVPVRFVCGREKENPQWDQGRPMDENLRRTRLTPGLPAWMAR